MLGGLCMPLGVSVPFSFSTILPVSARGGGTGPGVQASQGADSQWCCSHHGCGVSSANPPASVAPDEETDLEGQVSCSSVQPPMPELT